jgi:hypothetical protein
MTHVKFKSYDEVFIAPSHFPLPQLTPSQAKLLREVFRLIVVTFIMSHTLTIAEKDKSTIPQNLRSDVDRDAYLIKNVSSRVVNRQLKYFFSRLQNEIASFVLKKLLQILESSKGSDKWPIAFITMLGVCMMLEDQQKTIHFVMSTRAATEGSDARAAQRLADVACKHIDEYARSLQQIFIRRYNAERNPLLNPNHSWEKEVGFEDKSSVEFIRKAAKLVWSKSKSHLGLHPNGVKILGRGRRCIVLGRRSANVTAVGYLRQRQNVSISHENNSQYSARLVSKFVFAFFEPYSG